MVTPTDKKILIAARQLLEDGGVEAVSMRPVAKAVGITVMAIYRHFPNRQALLDAVAAEGFNDLVGWLGRRRFTGNAETRLLKVLDVFVQFALDRPRLFELMFLTKQAAARRFPADFKAGRSPTANLAVDVIREGMARGEFRQEDPWEVVFELGAMTQGFAMLYFGGRIDATPSGFRKLCSRAFGRYLHGLCAQATPPH
jgi:AcrR family transcriptional regulator